MAIIYFAGMFLVISIAFYGIKSVKREDTTPAFCFALVAIFIVFIGTVATGIQRPAQTSDLKKVEKIRGLEMLLAESVVSLTKEFNNHLSHLASKNKTYPKVNPVDDISAYIVKYPEIIKISTRLAEVADQITKTQVDLYNLRTEKEFFFKRIIYRLTNPWFFTFILPDEAEK